MKHIIPTLISDMSRIMTINSSINDTIIVLFIFARHF